MPPLVKKKSSKKEKIENSLNVEPVILQLAIPKQRIDELLAFQNADNNEFNPQPYCKINNFESTNDEIIINTFNDKKNVNCYWCCHKIDSNIFGMPIKYDVVHNIFSMHGTFCSLECVAAHNYSIHNGSDRAWEIQSWIQMLADRYGYKNIIRPAPSKYLLKIFDGPMDIEEFRDVHKNFDKTYVLNISPFINISSQLEVLNTSFLNQDNIEKNNKNIKKKKNLDQKMNLDIINTCT